jgi:hemerythrin-like domain-containing protein
MLGYNDGAVGTPVQLIDELQAEHDVIDQVAGAFLTYSATSAPPRPASDGSAFLRFFRLYASHFHHAREEDTLFAAMRDRAGLPADRGPIATMVADHERMAALLDRITAGLEGGEATEALFRESVTAYVHALWSHIDAENSVLFPECGPRLRRNGVMELPSRPMAPDERDAMSAGEALVARYPPSIHPEVMRGDGCIVCPAFGVTCRGLELEWWNEWEWDEFEDRMSGG